MALTDQGFTPKSFSEIRNDISDNLKLALGSDIDTSATSRIGQFVDIVSNEIYSTWQAMQDVYNSWFPNTSTGVSLDNVAAITNTFRLPATSARASVYYVGDAGTVIPLSHQIQKTATGDVFLANGSYTISDKANAIIASNVATSGVITLSWFSTPIVAINWNDDTATIKAKIENHPSISDVTVLGSFDTVGGIHIVFNADSLTYGRNPNVVDSTQQNAIVAPDVATSGSITLEWDSVSIAAINWNDDEAAIKAKIEAHPLIYLVSVQGRFDSFGGIAISFASDGLTSRKPTVTASTLQNDGDTLTINADFAKNSLQRSGVDLSTIANFATLEDETVLSQSTGALNVPAISIRTITTPITGLNTVINFEAGIAGTDRETDAQLRARRESELQKIGTATSGGIIEALQDLANVTKAAIVENDSDIVVDSRPAHSFEVYVDALNTTEINNEIAQAIYNAKPVGIEVVSTDGGGRTGIYTDANGTINLVMPFSSITPVTIYVTVTRTTINGDYPSDGDDQIKANLISYFESLTLGDDVYIHRLYTPVNLVPGISDLEIIAGKTAGSQGSANIVIDPFELATLTEANITIA